MCSCSACSACHAGAAPTGRVPRRNHGQVQEPHVSQPEQQGAQERCAGVRAADCSNARRCCPRQAAGLHLPVVPHTTCDARCRAPGLSHLLLSAASCHRHWCPPHAQPSSPPCAASPARLTRLSAVLRHQEGEEGALQQHQGGKWLPQRVICSLCPTLGPEARC